MPKTKVTAPYQKAWSACEPVKLPTSAGKTGMIRPIDTMSIRTVSMINGIAAARSRARKENLKLGMCCVIPMIDSTDKNDPAIVFVDLTECRSICGGLQQQEQCVIRAAVPASLQPW